MVKVIINMNTNLAKFQSPLTNEVVYDLKTF